MLVVHEPTLMSSFFGTRLPRDQSFDEDTNSVKLRLKVPGYKPEDVDINVIDDVLTVSLEGEAIRRYNLADRIDHEGITAVLSLGILTVTLPLKGKASRKIKVLNGDSS